MRSFVRRLSPLVLLFAYVLGASGCGQIGPLYLPDTQAPGAPETPPAEDDSEDS